MYNTTGVHLPLDTCKYQQCCVVGCEGDIRTELVISQKDGSEYYLPFCHRVKCKVAKGEIQKRFDMGVAAKDIRHLDMSCIYIRPEDTDFKVRLDVWATRDQDAPEPPKPKTAAPASTAKAPVSNIYANEDWEYVDEIDRWRNTDGKIVHVRKLSDAELVDAILIIRDLNFKGITKKIAWTSKLYLDPKRPRHIYPKPTLRIGAHEAGEKLLELEAVVRQRGLL